MLLSLPEMARSVPMIPLVVIHQKTRPHNIFLHNRLVLSSLSNLQTCTQATVSHRMLSTNNKHSHTRTTWPSNREMVTQCHRKVAFLNSTRTKLKSVR